MWDSASLSSNMPAERENDGVWTAPSAYRPIPLQRVEVGGYLGQRVGANVSSMLAGLQSPMVETFEILARGESPKERAGSRLSDLFKWIEGAAYSLTYKGEESLKREFDRVTELVVKGFPQLQKESSYNNPYACGHFLQAASAHFYATGDTALLDIAVVWADHFKGRFDSADPLFDEWERSSHPCIEWGLISLYRATEEIRFLQLAEELVGRFSVTESVNELVCGRNARHAVCVEYLLVAAAELYLEKEDITLRSRLAKLWDELVKTRLYLPGGVGYREIIPEFPYDLPQVLGPREYKDVAETCASVGLMMLAWRLYGITGDPRYFDVIETTLYNHFLGALSDDHMGIYYFNPLRLTGPHPKADLDQDAFRRTRLPSLHKTSCCFPNAWRFLASLPEYVAASRGDCLMVNLYTQGRIVHSLATGEDVKLQVTTAYPHEESVAIRIDAQETVSFPLSLRVPGWCRNVSIRVDDTRVDRVDVRPGEYLTLERDWSPQTEIQIQMEMPVEILESDPNIAANLGQVGLRRGPLVYCLEQADCPVPLAEVRFPINLVEKPDDIVARFRDGFLGGLNVLELRLAVSDKSTQPEGERMKSPYWRPATQKEVAVQMVPYYARANRTSRSEWVTLLPISPKG